MTLANICILIAIIVYLGGMLLIGAAYSKRNEVDYEKKQVNLFETIMPVNGNVNDLVIGKEDTGASE